MALKFKITKKQYEALSEELQDQYALSQDGKSAELDVEGLPEPEDAGKLIRARDREKERADNLQEELAEVTAERDTLKKGQSSTDKDVARVTERYERKLEKANNDADARVNKMRGRIADGMMDTAAMTLAAKVSTAPKLFADHAKKRMEVVFNDDDEPTLKFKTADGKVSDTLKVDDLEKELVADKELSAIVIGSKAKGSSAPLQANPLNLGGAGADKPTDLSKASPSELVETIRAKVVAKRELEGRAA